MRLKESGISNRLPTHERESNGHAPRGLLLGCTSLTHEAMAIFYSFAPPCKSFLPGFPSIGFVCLGAFQTSFDDARAAKEWTGETYRYEEVQKRGLSLIYEVMYELLSICSGSSSTLTSKRDWMAVRTSWSVSPVMNVMARPRVPKRPARLANEGIPS